MAKHFDTLEFLGHISGEAMSDGLVRLADVAVLIQTTKITEVLSAIIKLPLVPRDEEYQFRRRSTNLLQKWNELIGPNDKNQAPTSASFAIGNEGEPERDHIRADERERYREKYGGGRHISTANQIPGRK